MKHRRSFYAISNHSPISTEEIERIINDVMLHVPSAFNSQSARVVLLIGKEHRKLWSIVKETLRKKMAGRPFEETEAKIDNCFASG
ncbi:nitroreductase family protein, partial [Bacteroides sp. OttesenSCG-928-F21]|nr:nitroreductase family protein [Bacteroides sp. OttesenSCG-928-F21]